MTPYHYSIVQCRDFAVRGEHRNVGLLVVSPAERKAWLRRASLPQRAHLLGDDAAFVRSLLEGLEEEARHVAREESAAVVHGWLRSRARPAEGSLRLTAPAMGIARDLTEEVRRLREMYLGRPSSPRKSAAEKVRDEILRTHGLRQFFTPREFVSGPASWRFPTVADAGAEVVVLNTLTFGQKSAEGLLDAAFKNAGRSVEVQRHHPEVRWLTLAEGPSNAAFSRARELMDEAGLGVIPPTAEALQAGLLRLGVLSGSDVPAEA